MIAVYDVRVCLQCVCVCVCTRAGAHTPVCHNEKMCQLDEWQATHTTLVCKVHKKKKKKTGKTAALGQLTFHRLFTAINPGRKSVYMRVCGAFMCARVCITAAPNDGVAL